MSQVFELYELVERILNHVPDITKCLRVNKYLYQCVLMHHDYLTMWGKIHKPTIADIVQYGSVKMMDLYIPSKSRIMFMTATTHGNIDFVKYMCKRWMFYPNTLKEAHKLSCVYAHTNIAKYLHAYAPTDVESIAWTSDIIKLPAFPEIYKYVIEDTFYSIGNPCEIFTLRCAMGDIEIAEDLREKINTEDFCELIKSLDVIYNILCSHNKKLIQLLRELNVNYAASLINCIYKAAKNGNLALIMYIMDLLNGGARIDYVKLIYEATTNDANIDVIKHFYGAVNVKSNRLKSLIIKACTNNCINILQFYISHKKRKSKDFYSNLLKIAITLGHINIAKYACSMPYIYNTIKVSYIKKHYTNSTIMNICEVLQYIKLRNNVSCVILTGYNLLLRAFIQKLVPQCKYLYDLIPCNEKDYKDLLERTLNDKKKYPKDKKNAISIKNSDLAYFLISKSPIIHPP